MNELLSVAQMARADHMTIEAGTPGIELMENAGRAVAEAARPLTRAGKKVLVACGPGNNGGDGFVAARLLAQAGCDVVVALAADPQALKGDARLAFERWKGETRHPNDVVPGRFGLIIDALFGAGLDRAITGATAGFVGRLNDSGVPIVAVDLPSGVNGDSGATMGVAVNAARTVTFFRRKPGHLIHPGRTLCGETIVADIGIDAAVLGHIAAQWRENDATLWGAAFPWPSPQGHKYRRGHALVLSGPSTRTGAARLAARAALRAGAGLVTVASPPDALAENAAQLTAIMLRSMDGAAGLEALLEDERLNALVMGPGLGTGSGTRALVETALRAGRAVVLDADALTSFADTPQQLFEAVRQSSGPVVMTPHGGEFARLFGTSRKDDGKLRQAVEAAAAGGAVIILKGADTVIAAPDGRAAVNANAPAYLATAGAGDVLAGIAGGLLAQGMPSFEAASAAVWLHGEAARRFGPGLIAEDLEKQLPAALSGLHRQLHAV